MQDMNNSRELFNLALAARKNAYIPYSKFAVGVALLCSEGKLYSGCNVENVSYPCGSCAETGAISAMINGGSSQILEILILSDGSELVSPCGACRQRIKEFSISGTLIHMANLNGIQKTCTIEELLPLAFNETELSK